MARKASVRYWKSREGYCCWHNGSQVLLAKGPEDAPDGPTYRAALKKFIRLELKEHGVTVSEVVERYLEWAKKHRDPVTVRSRESRLSTVKAKFGDEYVASLQPLDVQEWFDAQQERLAWSDSTARATMASFAASLAWAFKWKLTPCHPLKEIELPEDGSRGLECVLSPEQEVAVIDACKFEAERAVLDALRETGARPGEIMAAEAKHYDPAIRAIVYEAKVRKGEKSHKTRHTGKARVIYLRGRTAERVRQLVEEYPRGPLFRIVRRKRLGPNRGVLCGWSESNLLRLIWRLRKRTGVETLIPYSFRHTFAVRWLRSRKPIEALAEVLGTSIEMIQRHYGHLAHQKDYLRRLVDEIDDPAACG